MLRHTITLEALSAAAAAHALEEDPENARPFDAEEQRRILEGARKRVAEEARPAPPGGA